MCYLHGFCSKFHENIICTAVLKLLSYVFVNLNEDLPKKTITMVVFKCDNTVHNKSWPIHTNPINLF